MVSISFIDALRRIMKERNWNQEELAEQVGVAKSSVTYWLQGGLPDKAQLERVQDLLDDAKLDIEGITFTRMFRNFKQQLKRRGIDPGKYLN